MTGGDIRIRVLVDNAKGADGLLARWGLSLWIETTDARVLLDCGDSDAFLRNAEHLGIRLAAADAFVLSHGHYDHGGGIGALLEAAPSVPLVAHPAALAPRFSRRASGKVEPIGLPDRSLAALWSAHERLVWALRPLEVAPGVWATGPVPRRHPLEEAEPTFYLDSACTIPDQVVDDQAVWVETPAGVIVLCGCAHSGVMNTVRHIRETVARRGSEASGRRGGQAKLGPRDVPSEPMRIADDGLPAVRALVGGTHLLHAGADRLRATADYLDALELELCAPCHCTGKRATSLLRRRLPRAFAAVVTGSRLRLR